MNKKKKTSVDAIETCVCENCQKKIPIAMKKIFVESQVIREVNVGLRAGTSALTGIADPPSPR